MFPPDSIGSVAFHPTSARLLSNSGSRDFDYGFSDSDSDSDSSSDNDNDTFLGGALDAGNDVAAAVLAPIVRNKRQPRVRDSSLKLWKFE